MSELARLPRRPEARTEKVEDLVDRVKRGFVRVPRFQRRLNWGASDVVSLFDSIYRGYPIGSLLYYKRPAEAELLEVGPLSVKASETREAWWVVDGQQRVTALAASLSRPVPIPTTPSDPYVVYFDAAKQRFVPPTTTGRIPSTWVPLPYLLDASQLAEWVYQWEHGDDGDLRRTVFEAGTRIRDYLIPLYLIEAEDERVAEQVFYRVNKSGKPLRWEDVHRALFGGEEASPSTLDELADALVDVGMGRLDNKRLLTCLFALRGYDPTRTLAEHYRSDHEFLRGAVLEGLPVLRRMLSFLRQDAGILHLRLLPKSILLDVLTRFFARHEAPKPRSRMLLARWFWRVVFGAAAFDERTLRRRGIQAVTEDEEESVQRLLALVRKERPRALALAESFDSRSDENRIAMLTLAHLGPRDLLNGRRIDVADLLEREDNDAFVKIIKYGELPCSRSPANRLIQTKRTPVQRLLLHRIATHGPDDPVLDAHAIDEAAAIVLEAGEAETFVILRAERLTEEVGRFSERMAAWEHSDRPSIEHLLREAGVEA